MTSIDAFKLKNDSKRSGDQFLDINAFGNGSQNSLMKKSLMKIDKK